MTLAPPEPVQTSAKRPGDEPLPGYRLISPLGRGGFGEVWKCEAPGGLHKAIKFVASDEANNSLRQEYDAFQKIKAIRHPFLLQLERVELTADELVMVMELADTQMQERFLECRNQGLPGIPRSELLACLADAAEALDVISIRHGLQHLDVKPANLFIICGRVKVGDYGLVRAETTASSVNNRGFTPRYVAPEVLVGRVDPRSDQYSLALVYQELLTGVFPYTARTAQQMMLAHTNGKPDLTSLPPEDAGPVAIALSKKPEERYPSCLAFIEALMTAGAMAQRHDTLKPNDTPAVNTMRMTRVQTASGYLSRSGQSSSPARSSSQHGTALPAPYAAAPPALAVAAGPFAPPPPQFGAAPLSSTLGSRQLITPKARSGDSKSGAQHPFGRSEPLKFPTSRSSIVPDEPIELVVSGAGRKVQLTDAMLRSVLPTTVLTGHAVVPASVTGEWLVNAIMAAAAGEADSLGRKPDGTWSFRFRSTHPVSVARQKLEAMKSDEWFDEIIDRDSNRVLLRRFAATGLLGRFGGKKAGLELEVNWPVGRGGEVELSAKLFGEPDAKFAKGTSEAMPRLFHEVRSLLKAGDERRKHLRVPVNFPVTLYPLKDDGEVFPPVAAKCRNVSAGGIAVATLQPLPTRYVYVEFNEVNGIAGLALLTKLIRSQPNGTEHLFSGKFRVDL